MCRQTYLHTCAYTQRLTYYHVNLSVFLSFSLYIYTGAFNKFPAFFLYSSFKISIDSWKFSMLLLHILWNDWPIFMNSASNEQLQQQLEYTLLKPDCHSWWISKIQSGTLEERYAIKFCFLNLEKMLQKHMECFRLLLEDLVWIEHQFLSGIRDSRKAGSLWGMMRGVGGVRKSIHQISKRFRQRRPGCFKSGQWHFHQDNIPVHNSILVTDYLSKMCINTVPHCPYSPDLTPCDFWLFPKRLSIWDNWGDERGCDEGHWHAYTRRLPWSLPEVGGMVQQVHCSRRRLLQRGLEFHVCTINKVPIWKKSRNLFNDPRIYIYYSHWGTCG